MSTLLTSLSQSFLKVPPAAVPALLDCILSSTGESPLSVFDSLLPHFSSFIEDVCGDNDNKKLKLSSEECAYLVSYIRGVCHLLKKIGVNAASLERFFREAFMPAMKMTPLYEKETLHEIVQFLLEVISETNS